MDFEASETTLHKLKPAHDYMSWDLDLLWETLTHRTPMLEETGPKLVKWDANHPVAPLDKDDGGAANAGGNAG